MTNLNYDVNEDGTIEIPVRVTSSQTSNIPERDEDIVQDYEEQYFGTTNDVPPYTTKAKRGESSGIWERVRNFEAPPRHRYKGRRLVAKDDSDRIWAALAHASAVLIPLAMVGVVTLPSILLVLLVPLGIYLAFRKRSEYVAFHALQAFAFQTVCTIGAIIVLFILAAVTIVSAVASFLLIGIPFLILFGLLLFLAGIMSVLVVFVFMPLYALIAANATWNGRNYRYPWVADWVDDQLLNGLLQN